MRYRDKPIPCPICNKDLWLTTALSGAYSEYYCSVCKKRIFFMIGEKIKVKRAKQRYWNYKGKKLPVYTKQGLKERWLVLVDDVIKKGD